MLFLGLDGLAMSCCCDACSRPKILMSSCQVMLGGGHINADMQQFLENDKKAQG